jgi:hypothetical protein
VTRRPATPAWLWLLLLPPLLVTVEEEEVDKELEASALCAQSRSTMEVAT